MPVRVRSAREWLVFTVGSADECARSGSGYRRWRGLRYSDDRFDNRCRSAENDAMNVSLPNSLEEFIRRKVAAGEFESADAVVWKGCGCFSNKRPGKLRRNEKLTLAGIKPNRASSARLRKCARTLQRAKKSGRNRRADEGPSAASLFPFGMFLGFGIWILGFPHHRRRIPPL